MRVQLVRDCPLPEFVVILRLMCSPISRDHRRMEATVMAV